MFTVYVSPPERRIFVHDSKYINYVPLVDITFSDQMCKFIVLHIRHEDLSRYCPWKRANYNLILPVVDFLVVAELNILCAIVGIFPSHYHAAHELTFLSSLTASNLGLDSRWQFAAAGLTQTHIWPGCSCNVKSS